MRNDLTDITVVMDRSGSMADTKGDAEKGLNFFVSEQKKQPGDARFTLVQFDTEYEFVHRAIPILEVPPLTLMPRGSTALLDAVGRAITETGERLKAVPETERPGLVVFVIVTDGQENASREFTRVQIKSMVEHQQAAYQWQFMFLGANQDAFAEAGSLGIAAGGTANVAVARMDSAYGASASNTSRMRRQARAGKAVSNRYTQKEQDDMLGKKGA